MLGDNSPKYLIAVLEIKLHTYTILQNPEFITSPPTKNNVKLLTFS